MRSSVTTIGDLDTDFILSPERYIGRETVSMAHGGVLLSELVAVRKETVSASKPVLGRLLLADTGDAEDGLLKLDSRNEGTPGSNKKRVYAGDVLISRLRPYLRQVAYADVSLFSLETSVAVSTEFYVLRPIEEISIAFLVPWLLSDRVQAALAASLEGAHHPRFHVSTLLRLRVPRDLVKGRVQLSQSVEEAASHYRTARKMLDETVERVEAVSTA